MLERIDLNTNYDVAMVSELYGDKMCSEVDQNFESDSNREALMDKIKPADPESSSNICNNSKWEI